MYIFRIVLTPLLVFSTLQAEGIDAKELNSIYIEAMLFVTVFGLMSIASIFISKRHAKQNALEASLKKSQDKVKENSQTISRETTRIKELSKMLDDGLITDKEFQILKSNFK